MLLEIFSFLDDISLLSAGNVCTRSTETTNLIARKNGKHNIPQKKEKKNNIPQIKEKIISRKKENIISRKYRGKNVKKGKNNIPEKKEKRNKKMGNACQKLVKGK